MKFILLSALSIVLFASCTTIDVYEKNTFFSKHEWNSTEKPSFTFTVKDTAALYNIYIVLRHEDAYRYNNLWVNVTTQGPDGAASTQQLQLQLGDNSKGWLGSGMDDIYQHMIRITRAPIPLKKGDYHFSLQHIMREDPLQHILNAGVRVEKATP